MDSREYFMEIRAKYYKMAVIEDEIKELCELAQRAGAMDYSKERVQTGEAVKEPAFVKALDKIDEQKHKYFELLNDYEDYRRKAHTNLNKLKDGINVQILYLKFFKFEKLEDIAIELNYSFEAVRKRYQRAMHEFDVRRLWEE